MIDTVYLEDGGVLVTAVESLSGHDLILSKEELYASEEKTRSIAYQLADFRKVSEVSLSSAAVAVIAKKDRQASEINARMMIAVVVSDDLHYGLSRMWEEYCRDSTISAMVCRNMEEARQWINEKQPPMESDTTLQA